MKLWDANIAQRKKTKQAFHSIVLFIVFFSYNVLTLLFGKTAAVAANHRQQQKPHQNQHDKWNLVPFHLGFVHSTCKALSISLSTFDLFDDLDWNEMRANKTKWEKKKLWKERKNEKTIEFGWMLWKRHWNIWSIERGRTMKRHERKKVPVDFRCIWWFRWGRDKTEDLSIIHVALLSHWSFAQEKKCPHSVISYNYLFSCGLLFLHSHLMCFIFRIAS